MDQNNTPPRTISYPAMAASSSGSSAAPSSSSARSLVRGPTTSAMLSQSSSSSAHSHRGFRPSRYPPPAPVPGRLASGSGSGSGSGSSSRLRQIAPPSPKAARGGGSKRRTFALPTPFLSELESIRRVSASLFSGIMGPRATRTHITATLLGQQAPPPPPPPSMSEFVMPSSGAPRLPLLQPLPQAPPSSNDLLASLPSGSFSAGLAPCHTETSTLGSSSWPAQQQALPSLVSSDPPLDLMSFCQPSGNDDGTAGAMQQPASASSELAPLPPTLHTASPLFQVNEDPIDGDGPCREPMVISLDGDDDGGLSAMLKSFTSSSEPPSLPGLEAAASSEDRLLLGGGGGSSSRPCARDLTAVDGSEQSWEAAMTPRVIMYDKVNTGGTASSSSGGGVSIPWNCQSSMSASQEPALPQFMPSENPPQSNTFSAGSGFVQQQEQPTQEMSLIPSSQDRLQLNSSIGGGTNPSNCHGSMSISQAQQHVPQLSEPVSSAGFSDFIPQWQPSPNNTFQEFVQEQTNLQMPLMASSTDKLQLNSTSGPSIWSASSANGSGQSWEAIPVDRLQLNNSICGTNPSICHDSMSISQAQQQQAPQLSEPVASGFSDFTPQGQPSPDNTLPVFIQQNPNLQVPLLPSYTDKLQLNNTGGPSLWSNAGANSSGQGSEAMPVVASSRFDQTSIAGGSIGIGQQGWPAMPPTPSNNNSVFGTGDGGSRSIISASASMPWNLSSSSMQCSNSMTKLSMVGMEKNSRLPPRPPSLKIGASASSGMSRRDAHGDFFSDAEMEAINKDKLLKKIVSTDPRRVKRILSNRLSVAKLNAQKTKRGLDLERQSEELQKDCVLLSTQVLSHKATNTKLNVQNSEMRHKLQMLNEQASMNEALCGQLKSEIQSLKSLQLNMLRANGINDPMLTQMAGENGSYADGLYPLQNSNINFSSGSHQLATQVQPPQHEQQPHQTIVDEFVMGQQHKPSNF